MRYNTVLDGVITVYLMSEMRREGIEPVEFDEDELVTPDVRDMVEMEVQQSIYVFIFSYHNMVKREKKKI